MSTELQVRLFQCMHTIYIKLTLNINLT